MKPKYHIAIGFIVSFILLLTPLTNIQIIVFFFASWLFIDLDHYFRYILIRKNFSIKGFLNFSKKEAEKWKHLSKNQQKQFKNPIFIFHNLEFLLLLFLISIYFPILKFVAFGFILHLLTDYLGAIITKKPLLHKFSLSATFVNNKNKKKLV